MVGISANCSHLTNNISESFNAFIGDAKAKPIIYCIDAIRLKIMVNMNKRRLLAKKWTGVLVPEVQKIITELSKNKRMYDVHRSSVDRAEVDGPEGRYDVILSERASTCRKWQVTGIPYHHAAAVICHMRGSNWEDYVYKRAYGMAIAPLPDKSMWEIEDLNYVVKPPVQTRPPPGRPRKKRIRPADEGSSQSKVRRIHVCRRCGGYGHLQRTCKNPPKPQSSEDPSSEASRKKDMGFGLKKKKEKGNIDFSLYITEQNGHFLTRAHGN
ncbi:hypothetical protein QJS10_CPB12g00032 [Acorus calamus]|uniref:CCHC-type domain-containing protein n=1 Tax=Acorus calamus TaxID=4465 RepID=A0AAV9DP61_ACOCL|nr:hypothetical protein QJS10_CPB12g00032 [Acorus calamus]